MSIPPGITYTFNRLPSLLIPPACVYHLHRLVFNFAPKYFTNFTAKRDLNQLLPVWLWIVLGLLSWPLTMLYYSKSKEWDDDWECTKRGAEMPPTVKDDSGWPLGIGIIRRQVKDFATAPLGALSGQLMKDYGNTFHLKTLGESRIFTTEPHHVKAILATEFDSFEKGPGFREQYQTLLGTGVFNSDGDLWKFHRSMTRPFFSRDRISDFDLFDLHADQAIRLIKSRIFDSDEAQKFDGMGPIAINIQDVASRYTLDTATAFLFGKNVESLSAGLPYPHYASLSKFAQKVQDDHPANRFARAFEKAQNAAVVRTKYGKHWPLREFFKDKPAEWMKEVDAFIQPLIRHAVQKMKASGEKKLHRVNPVDGKKGVDEDREVKEGECLLDHLVHYTDNPNILRDETLNILLAGRDTTACTITFCTYMLAEHQNVFEKLRKEILERLGPTKRPTFDDMKDMKYLRAVINETLRLYPPVPMDARSSTEKGAVLPNGDGKKPYYVPPSTRIAYSVFLMHRREDLWGPDAMKFDPERFIDERVQKYLVSNPYIFVPFNAGPRICLGQQFAYHEASFFIIRLLQNFQSIELVPEAIPLDSRPPEDWGDEVGPLGREKVWPTSHLTLYAKGGIWVTMTTSGT